jgi:uncharacterized MAPEG superfamily protein
MTTPLWCLLFFAFWTLLLVAAGIVPYRVGNVVAGRAKSNGFPATTPHGPEWYQRLIRAHANCVENLPVFGAVVLVGHLAGLSTGHFATLSTVYVAARVGQSVMHIASGRNLVVNVRFTFFAVQLIALTWMMVLLAQHG